MSQIYSRDFSFAYHVPYYNEMPVVPYLNDYSFLLLHSTAGTG